MRDLRGELAERLSGQPPGLYLLRPDRYVAGFFPPAEVSAVVKHRKNCTCYLAEDTFGICRPIRWNSLSRRSELSTFFARTGFFQNSKSHQVNSKTSARD